MKETMKAKLGKRVNRTLIFFALLIAPLVAVVLIDHYALVPINEGVRSFATALLYIAGIYFTAALVLKLTLSRFINGVRDVVETEQRIILAKAYTFGVYAFATVFVIWQLGVDAGNITILLGLITTGLAFAIRDVLMAILAWLILLVKKPFRIGDYIRIDDDQGKVMHIGTFYVVLDDTPDTNDDYVRVPNALFLQKSITNLGTDRVTQRLTVPLHHVDADLPNRVETLRDEVDGDVSVESDEKWKVVVTYKATLDDRSQRHDDVLANVLTTLKPYLHDET